MTTLRKPCDGRSAPLRIRAMRQSRDATRRQVGLILEAFASERRTEGAFYLRFCALAPMQVEALARLWLLDAGDPWPVFRRVCRFFGL